MSKRLESPKKLDEVLLNKLGIFNEQIQYGEFYHNVGWYTQFGRKIGWGDLTPKDIEKLIKNIPEPMLILHEQHSFWNFVSVIGSSGKTSIRDADREKLPTLDYLFDNCFGIIVPDYLKQPGTLYFLTEDYDGDEPFEKVIRKDQFQYIKGHRSQARTVMLGWYERVRENSHCEE